MRSSRGRWLAALGLVLAALATTGGPVGAQEAGVAKRISVEEAKAAVAQGTAVLVDVRGQMAFDAGHAKGALSIPYSDLAIRLNELPKDKLIITYCT